MVNDSKSNVGLKRLISYYKNVFRTPENLNHYRAGDYKIAGSKFLKHALKDHSGSYQKETE
jgi:hypothetical protein